MQPSLIYIIARLRAIVNKNYSVYNICIKYVAGYLIMIVYDKLWKTMQAKGVSRLTHQELIDDMELELD